MSKSAYSILAQDCESSDSIVRYAKIKAVKAEIALDECCLERDSQLHETIIPRGCCEDVRIGDTQLGFWETQLGFWERHDYEV